MADEPKPFTPADGILVEYSIDDPDSICRIDHEAMAREIVRLRALREMAIEQLLTPNDVGRIRLTRALMQPPELAV